MIQELIDRYLNLEDSKKLPYEKISELLGVSFSNEFIEISSQVGFDYFGNFSWFNSDQTENYSIIGETKDLRTERNLPNNTLWLTEDDASLLFMKCLGDHEEIFWIAIEDGERFCEGKPLEYDYDFFPTFADFFKYLLDEEEKSRAEDEASK